MSEGMPGGLPRQHRRRPSTARVLKPWEQYEQQAAGLLRELGFSTKVEESLTEANGTVDEIDVAARRKVAGVDVLWIVECKFWNTSVDMGAARELRSLVLDLGADRGLLMSESDFQPGAVDFVRGKPITLTSLSGLRAAAADEILAARVAAADKRLMDITVKVLDAGNAALLALRHTLAGLASQLRPEDVEEFARRPEAGDFGESVLEMERRVGRQWISEYAQSMPASVDKAMPWLGIDRQIIDRVSTVVNSATVALHQGRRGEWPVLCVISRDDSRLAWSMEQLIDVVELMLHHVERPVTRQ